MKKFYENRLELLRELHFELDFTKIDTTTVFDRTFKHDVGNNICLIGEAPGQNEVIEGVPFCGQAGKNLSNLISLSSIPRERFCITNGFCFRTFTDGARGVINRAPTTNELKAGATLLSSELELLRPKMIVLLGNSALKAFGYINDSSITKTLKTAPKHKVVSTHSDILGGSVLIAHTYHPSPLVYNQPQKRAVLENFFGEVARCL